MVLDIAYIHPTLLVTLTDHFYRIYTSNDKILQSRPLIGIILGKISNNTTSLLNGFELPYVELQDENQLNQHLLLLSEIYGKDYLQLVGFYIINGNSTNILSNIFENLKQIKEKINNDKSIINNLNLNDLIIMNINNIEKIKEVQDLKTLIEIVNINNNNNNNNSPMKYEIRFIKAENLTISTYENAPKVGTELSENSITNDISMAINDLGIKLKKALQFLSKVKSGEIDITKSKDSEDAIKSLMYLSGKSLALKSLLNKRRNNTDNKDQLNKIIALSSFISSLLRENLEYSL
jgi:hypothetical protein